ncbi:MAG: bifunctional folylpolyglutamate synthase/dihydrofolate synthase [Flavobacteriaceae bacterium]|nr:bifunctional folylpolyglutamate synthase/dihydrofolate synthase [Flavobacteriaceae bacterium]
MTYTETIQWMFTQLPMYQRQGKTAFKKDLTNICAFSEHLNRPETKFKSIHVAGTNGKGSTSHMIASILQEAGFKVGLYTSPHLKDFRERIKINGQEVTEDYVVNFIRNNQSFLESQKLSFFEMTVGLAFDYFAHEQVDFAIIEVGLGGRLDSTNILQPEIAVITNIGLDHTQFLGTTLPEIAAEKGGIIKHKIPTIIGEYQEESFPVFEQLAFDLESPLYLAEILIEDSYECDLKGSYQYHNIKTAVATIDVLNDHVKTITNDHIKKGLLNVVKNTQLLGRWQEVQTLPRVLCDTGHNKEGLDYVLTQLKTETYETLHFVFGVVNDKDLSSILDLFPKNAVYYFCKPDIPRGLDAAILKNTCEGYGLHGELYPSVNEAYKTALQCAKNSDLIFVGGSTFIVAEIL